MPESAKRNSHSGLFSHDRPQDLTETARKETRPHNRNKALRGVESSGRVRKQQGNLADRSSSGTEELQRISSSNLFSFDRSDHNREIDGPPSAAARNLANGKSSTSQKPPRKLIIGLDYGTTFSSLSYIDHPMNSDRLDPFPWEVKSISSWPNTPSLGSPNQIPTESWYSLVPPTRGAWTSFASLATGDSGGISDDSSDDFDYEDNNIDQVAQFNDTPMDFDREENNQTTSNDLLDHKFLWGYSVSYEQFSANSDRNPWGLVRYAKTKLLSSDCTVHDREKLNLLIEELIQRKVVNPHAPRGKYDPRDVQDVISDFLTELFVHSRKLFESTLGYTDSWVVQFVMTVPSIWSPQSSRVLQDAMAASIVSSGFGTLGQGCIDNLIILKEPEAAAFYLMRSDKRLIAGETFALLDCGGGTVDTVVYTVDTAYPLRLGKEEVPADGDNCGGSYANLNFQSLMEKRLENETYLFTNGETKQSIVNRLVNSFERDYKRNQPQDPTKKRWHHRIHISNLIGDDEREPGEAKRFNANYLIMDQSDYRTIFEPLLVRIVAILANQLELAYQKGKPVKKVFLVGGFGEAPMVQNFLKHYLNQLSSKLGYEIQLIKHEGNEPSLVTAISAGAVLRAHNMDNGPARISQSSYGFLRNEPYDTKHYPQHDVGGSFIDSIDGDRYIATIAYFMFKEATISSKHEFKSFICIHSFPQGRSKLICKEVLYVLDRVGKSHYTKDHENNRGLQVAGTIVTDMTWLKKELSPIRASKTGTQHYRVEYELVIIAEGRNLRYEARYPVGAGVKGKVQKAKQVSIAAAFEPGTK